MSGIPIHMQVSADAGTKAADRIARLAASHGLPVTVGGGQVSAHLNFAFCACCGGMAQATATRHVPSLGGEVCAVCHEVAVRIRREFFEAATRAWGEMRGQLKQAVMDVRGGAEVPQFYRGHE